MIYAMQKHMKRIGSDGCYFLSLLMIAEKVTGVAVEPVAAYVAALAAGDVSEDCIVKRPDAVLARHCGGTWRVLWAGTGKRSNGAAYDLPLDYVCLEGEYDVLRYERPADRRLGEKEPMPHFGVGDGRGGKTADGDPWGDSRTFREGKLVSRRIIRGLS